ncbi:uncharacterized protein LOC108452676 [Gossypium arboreum]|nr:uncharacterized protein LOC108452676 [Gossypium arboreum]
MFPPSFSLHRIKITKTNIFHTKIPSTKRNEANIRKQLELKKFHFLPSKTHHYLCPIHPSPPSQHQMLMAALSISENDNKENISPFSSKTPLSLLPKSSSSIIKKPRPRKPLQDITNLLLPQISSSLPPPNAANLVSPQALVYQPQWRKRRAGDGHQSNCMKSRFVYKCINLR